MLAKSNFSFKEKLSVILSVELSQNSITSIKNNLLVLLRIIRASIKDCCRL